MEPGQQQPTLHLRRKYEDNDIDSYTSVMNPNDFGGPNIQAAATQFLLNIIKQHPENYFNFGFTYNDFKAFLLKLLYMRAQRGFIEAALTARINQRHAQQQEHAGIPQPTSAEAGYPQTGTAEGASAYNNYQYGAGYPQYNENA